MNISVIVPCYKRIKQTIRTIGLLYSASGVGSKFSLECIVADSTPDDSLKCAVLESYPSVVYIRPDKPGIAANKNAGARKASHQVMMFCDSDMEIEPETLNYAIIALQTYPEAAAVGGRVMWRGGPHDGALDRPRSEDRQKDIAGTVFIEAIYSRFLATYKDVFWTVGGYDEELFAMRGEGSDLSIRYWRAGFPLVFDRSIVVHHVHDVPDIAAVRISGTNVGIAKDLVLLSHKYGMIDKECPNFAHTIEANFGSGIRLDDLMHMPGVIDTLHEKKAMIEAFQKKDHPMFDMKFLEVFTQDELFARCIEQSHDRLKEVRSHAFV